MYEYGHGGNAVFERGNEGIIDLSANMNPLGMPESVTDAIIREIPNCARYPDSFSSKLRDKIAEFEGAEPGWVFCGNGTSDIIFRLPRAAQAKKVMVTAPAFSDYERSAASYGSVTARFGLTPENDFDIDGGFIEAVRREEPDLVFLCNPNNPTGRLVEAGFTGELLDNCRQTGARVVVDECFLDFTEQAENYSSKVFLERFPNLVILKAFTKVFALAGVRLGYAICSDQAIIDGLRFHGADWPVSSFAQAAGLAALKNAGEFIKKTRAYVSGQRVVIEKTLALLGYKVFRSQANYVFFRSPYPFNLCAELDGSGIRIRSCGNFHELDDSYYRVAISTEDNNDKFIAAITTITEPYINERKAP